GEIEDKFLVPLYGSRNLLRTEEREEERSYYWLLEKAKLAAPERIEDPRDIEGLSIVKLPHKVKKLELLGVDWRFETSLDGHVRLPADQQISLADAERIPEYVVVGHNSATLRESSLKDVFDMAERYVAAT
ncbi:MAG: DUF1297 domain-containing protein, partial [Methanobacteriota archaeon]